MIEVKAKVFPDTLDSSLYYKDHKMKITSSPTWYDDYNALKVVEKET